MLPRSFWTTCLAVLVLCGCGAMALVETTPAASQTAFNEREVQSTPSQFDKAGVWAMDFRFKDPRIIKVKLPKRGERICWYLWYQLINRSGKAEEVQPYFELVTLDNPDIYRDEILFTAEEAIRKIEDPAKYQDIKNTVMISKFPIPPSKPADEAFPKPVTGVAIWDAGPADPKQNDPKQKELSESMRFTIFVRGLSNGSVEVDSPAPGQKSITQYKTLQLNFKRKGDRFSTDSRDMEFVSPALWTYRSASRTIPTDKKEDDKGK